LVTAGISEQGRSLTVLSETPEGEPFLTIMGVEGGQALTLFPDEPVQIGDREYVFEGTREFAGIEVRKDPGAKFIWIAAGLLLVGLLATFYLPRLRLWVRIRGGETVVASLAERRGVFRSEMKHLLRALDAARIEPEGDTTKSD
jgi:cytochrome c biogenesis protein ResB